MGKHALKDGPNERMIIPEKREKLQSGGTQAEYRAAQLMYDSGILGELKKTCNVV